MDVRIYSVKAETQAVDLWVYVMTTHKEQGCKMLRPRIQERALLELRVHFREYN